MVRKYSSRRSKYANKFIHESICYRTSLVILLWDIALFHHELKFLYLNFKKLNQKLISLLPKVSRYQDCLQNSLPNNLYNFLESNSKWIEFHYRIFSVPIDNVPGFRELPKGQVTKGFPNRGDMILNVPDRKSVV